MNKQHLHDEIDALIPSTTVTRSQLRIVAHALVELGLMTAVECGWSGCTQESRSFAPYNPEKTGSRKRDPRVPSIDHVVSRSDGGSDLPSNIQIIHFACNALKGQADSRKNPDIIRAHSEGMKRMWADPEKRADRIRQVSAALQRPEVKNKKSESMKTAWDTVTAEERRQRALKAWETRRANQMKDGK